jgi:signal transduction histidine kinase
MIVHGRWRGCHSRRARKDEGSENRLASCRSKGNPMRAPGWMLRSIHMSPLTTRDMLLFSALYIYNFIVYSGWANLGQVPTRTWLLLAWLYGLVVLVPLLWRDEAPVAVFATQWVLTVAAWPFMRYYEPMVGIVVAVYSVAVHRGRRASLLALLASFIPLGLELTEILNVNANIKAHTPFEVFFTNGTVLVASAGWAWGLGRVNQASQRRVQDLEREREAAREADVLATERRRIARELHDIVSHSVTVIVLLAAGAARVAHTDFAQVTRSLAHIETAGKQAMAELRRLLGVLEDDDGARREFGGDEFRPQPGLANLPELLSSLREAGMPVTVQVEGTPVELDSGLDLTAYRSRQEGRSNVLKHGGKAANPQLRLTWEPHLLSIQIDNDTILTRTTTLSGGRGLVGLRERAHSAGGTLCAGPRPQGGYRLTATIPLAPGVLSVPRASSQHRGNQGKVSA